MSEGSSQRPKSRSDLRSRSCLIVYENHQGMPETGDVGRAVAGALVEATTQAARHGEVSHRDDC